MRTIVAVDPGKTTGVAILTWENEVKFYQGAFLEVLGEVSWYLDSTQLCVDQEPTHCVIERYVIPQRAYNAPWSLEVIGAVKWACHLNDATWSEQRAADAMKFCPNELLQRIGWWARGKEHARDATRHLVKYLADHEPSRLPVIGG